MSLCCHTGNLEVYHSVQTRYVPKRQHFSYRGMVARTQLAALDHNANNGRQQATVTRGANQGELQYKLVFPKHTKEWVAKPIIMEKPSRDYLNPILDTIVDRKRQKPMKGVQHSQPRTFLKILLANLGLQEQTLLLKAYNKIFKQLK